MKILNFFEIFEILEFYLNLEILSLKKIVFNFRILKFFENFEIL
jgi:hypothetical protein